MNHCGQSAPPCEGCFFVRYYKFFAVAGDGVITRARNASPCPPPSGTHGKPPWMQIKLCAKPLGHGVSRNDFAKVRFYAELDAESIANTYTTRAMHSLCLCQAYGLDKIRTRKAWSFHSKVPGLAYETIKQTGVGFQNRPESVLKLKTVFKFDLISLRLALISTY